jgi:hypothetical protein
VFGFGTLDAEDHVSAGEGSTVMEGDPMAQLHLPSRLIEAFPARGKLCLEPPISIVVDKSLVDLALDPGCEQNVIAVRIEALGRPRRRPAHDVFRLHRRGESRQD